MASVILCAADGSEASKRTLGTARWLGDALDGRLVVVHVQHGSEDADADRLAESLRAQLGDEQVDVRFVEGTPALAIMKEADRDGAELIVVGSHGHGALRSALLGSVSRSLAEEASCPVVIVPAADGTAGTDGGGTTAEASVVCGVDGSNHALAAAIFAGDVARRLGWRLVIVHAQQNVRSLLVYPGTRLDSPPPPVTGQPDAVARQVSDLVKRAVDAAGSSDPGMVEPGPPAEVLESVADRERAGLLVIASRGIGGVRAALLGSVTSKLAASAPCPVVVLPEAAATRSVESSRN
jgi:nucleotide-binding universal stress UspA family protein